MVSLREHIHQRVEKLEETVLPELNNVLDQLESKQYDPKETMALWETFAEPIDKDLEVSLIATLERRPLFDRRRLVLEPDA